MRCLFNHPVVGIEIIVLFIQIKPFQGFNTLESNRCCNLLYTHKVRAAAKAKRRAGFAFNLLALISALAN